MIKILKIKLNLIKQIITNKDPKNLAIITNNRDFLGNLYFKDLQNKRYKQSLENILLEACKFWTTDCSGTKYDIVVIPKWFVKARKLFNTDEFRKLMSEELKNVDYRGRVVHIKNEE